MSNIIKQTMEVWYDPETNKTYKTRKEAEQARRSRVTRSTSRVKLRINKKLRTMTNTDTELKVYAKISMQVEIVAEELDNKLYEMARQREKELRKLLQQEILDGKYTEELCKDLPMGEQELKRIALKDL